MDKMIIIGGGAAGMMTAIKAAKRYNVTLIEKNEKLGKKLFITGKGRCNITNDSDKDTFLNNVPTNSRILFSAINEYDQSDVIRDFKSWGLPLKTERGNRIFPVSDHSSDVIKTLENEMKKNNVQVLLNTKCEGFILEDYYSDDPKSKYEKKITGVRLRDNKGVKTLKADKVVLCTGGASYSTTGSTGEGLEYLSMAGISTKKFMPSLVPFNIKESFCKEMMGLSLKNVNLKIILRAPKDGKKKKDRVLYDEFGEMLFTHFGISGPLVLTASSYINKYFNCDTFKAENDLECFVDIKPALDIETLDKRILRDFESNENKEFQNVLGLLLPRLMVPVVIKLSGIDEKRKVNMITHDERMKLISVLKNFPMTIDSLRGMNEAIISSGGVLIKEIDPRTMELKKIKNLKVAGEIIDCDALTGGFNLQIAWSTACLAADDRKTDD